MPRRKSRPSQNPRSREQVAPSQESNTTPRSRKESHISAVVTKLETADIAPQFKELMISWIRYRYRDNEPRWLAIADTIGEMKKEGRSPSIKYLVDRMVDAYLHYSKETEERLASLQGSPKERTALLDELRRDMLTLAINGASDVLPRDEWERLSRRYREIAEIKDEEPIPEDEIDPDDSPQAARLRHEIKEIWLTQLPNLPAGELRNFLREFMPGNILDAHSVNPRMEIFGPKSVKLLRRHFNEADEVFGIQIMKIGGQQRQILQYPQRLIARIKDEIANTQ